MVTGDAVPVYDLQDVRTAARELSISYRGRKVLRDASNLGYELKDIAACLRCLTEDNFVKTHVREGIQPDDDEYICRYQRPNSEDDEEDELYIKFCLIGGCLEIDLGSFHLPQY